MKTKSKNYSIGVRFWIKEDRGHFLGNGRIALLENIRKTGSITMGAKAMNMSYRQAWQMVQDMNERAEQPLVSKILGGRGGGGAKLTAAGDHAIKVFHSLEKKIMKYAQELSEKTGL